LNQNLAQWIEELSADLPLAETARPTSPQAVVNALAQSMARKPLLCELISSMASELESNISAETVRAFKLAHVRLLRRLADLLRQHITALTPAAARELVSLIIVCTAGYWPFAHPSPAVAEAQRDPELAETKVDFAARLGRTLHIAVTGLLNLE